MKDKFGRQLVPCRLCGAETASTGTKLCDRCWELETRINHDPGLAVRILGSIDPDKLLASQNHISDLERKLADAKARTSKCAEGL